MKLNELYNQRANFFWHMPSTARGGLIFLVLAGFLTFIAGIVAGEETRTWGSFLFNLMFFFSIALGGVAFGSMQDLIGARWGRPIKRIHESFVSFLPIAVVLFVGFFASIKLDLFGAGKVYKWIADPDMIAAFHGKNVWLQADFMIVRDIIALLVILALATWHRRKTTQPDQVVLTGELDKAAFVGEESRKALRHWSAPVLVCYAFLYSLLSFDLIMSLAPTWFSTLWAGLSFSIMMQTLFALTMIFMFAFKNGPLGVFIQRQQFHDIGKLLFGFTAFYAYLAYSHVLTYWYTNIPEETSFFLTRMQEPWLKLLIVAPFASFLVPFSLLVAKPAKWTPYFTIPVCCLVLAAQWVNYLLFVIPEVADPASWNFPWIELGVMLGFVGLFFLMFARTAKRAPLLGIGDPLLLAALSSEH